MDFALSTCWFSEAENGNAIVDKVLKLGFDGLEIGYGLEEKYIPEILARRKNSEIAIRSVHAFGPVRPNVKVGHPELHRIANTDEKARLTAVEKVLEVLHFAEENTIEAVVLHAGRILEISHAWEWIHSKIANESDSGFFYKWRLDKMNKKRALLHPNYMGQIRKSLDALLPEFGKAGIKLCLENLPSFDALPQPDDLSELLKDYDGTNLSYWHDMGHGQVMENAGHDNHIATVKRFAQHIAGTHIHDVIGPAKDHQAPGTGGIDFGNFTIFAKPEIIRVFEPATSVTEDELKNAIELIKSKWSM